MQKNAPLRTSNGIHNTILRKAVTTHAGHVIEQEGDSWSVAFHRAVDAIAFCLQVSSWSNDFKVTANRVLVGVETAVKDRLLMWALLPLPVGAAWLCQSAYHAPRGMQHGVKRSSTTYCSGFWFALQVQQALQSSSWPPGITAVSLDTRSSAPLSNASATTDINGSQPPSAK